MPRILFGREKPLEQIASNASSFFRKLKIYTKIDELTWRFKILPEQDRTGSRLIEFKDEARAANDRLVTREKKVANLLRGHDRKVEAYFNYRTKLAEQQFKIRPNQVTKYRRMRGEAQKSTRLFAEYKSISRKPEMSSKREEEWREDKKGGKTPRYSARRNLDFIRMFGDTFEFKTKNKAPAMKAPGMPKWFS